MAEPDETLEAARDQVADRYLDEFGVNAVGIGTKVVGGQSRGQRAVRVFVTRKRPTPYLPASAVLPRTVHVRGSDVAIDVVQAGPFFALGVGSLADEIRPAAAVAAPGEFPGRYRPIPFGVSVGHHAITAGTVGCMVTDNADGSAQVLSNNHVFANVNAGSPGDAILQPGPIDGGTAAGDTVARLKRFVPIRSDAENRVDAAIATPVSGAQFLNSGPAGTVDEINAAHPAVGLLFAGDCSGNILACRASNVANELGIAFPGGHVEPAEGMVVEKVGRTTGWTVQRVSDVGLVSDIGFDGGGIRFVDLFYMKAFGHAGDSGSLIVRGEL